MGRQKGMKLPGSSLEEMTDAIVVKWEGKSNLTQFLQFFPMFAAIMGGSKESVKRLAYEFCEDSAKQRIIYSEVRYSPHMLRGTVSSYNFPGLPHVSVPSDSSSAGLSVREVIEAVNEGLDQGNKDFNITVKSILSTSRNQPAWAAAIVDLCTEYRDRGVVGIDLSGDENLTAGKPTQSPILQAFKTAVHRGINRVVHAGENGPAANVVEAVDVMQAQRISHGYHAFDDPALYQRLLEQNYHFEMCPVSSFLTGSIVGDYQSHPIKRIAQDKGNFGISTDDTLVTGTTLADEYNFVIDKIGLSKDDIIRANINAAKASFQDDQSKSKLVEKLQKAYGIHT